MQEDDIVLQLYDSLVETKRLDLVLPRPSPSVFHSLVSASLSQRISFEEGRTVRAALFDAIGSSTFTRENLQSLACGQYVNAFGLPFDLVKSWYELTEYDEATLTAYVLSGCKSHVPDLPDGAAVTKSAVFFLSSKPKTELKSAAAPSKSAIYGSKLKFVRFGPWTKQSAAVMSRASPFAFPEKDRYIERTKKAIYGSSMTTSSSKLKTKCIAASNFVPETKISLGAGAGSRKRKAQDTLEPATSKKAKAKAKIVPYGLQYRNRACDAAQILWRLTSSGTKLLCNLTSEPGTKRKEKLNALSTTELQSMFLPLATQFQTPSGKSLERRRLDREYFDCRALVLLRRISSHQTSRPYIPTGNYDHPYWSTCGVCGKNWSAIPEKERRLSRSEDELDQNPEIDRMGTYIDRFCTDTCDKKARAIYVLCALSNKLLPVPQAFPTHPLSAWCAIKKLRDENLENVWHVPSRILWRTPLETPRRRPIDLNGGQIDHSRYVDMSSAEIKSHVAAKQKPVIHSMSGTMYLPTSEDVAHFGTRHPELEKGYLLQQLKQNARTPIPESRMKPLPSEYFQFRPYLESLLTEFVSTPRNTADEKQVHDLTSVPPEGVLDAFISSIDDYFASSRAFLDAEKEKWLAVLQDCVFHFTGVSSRGFFLGIYDFL